MDPGEQAHQVKFMIRDRGPDYTAAFGTVLADAGSGPCSATSRRLAYSVAGPVAGASGRGAVAG
jgi:hypothetical protein